MKKCSTLWISPEIRSSFAKTLKELVLFAGSQVTSTFDWVGWRPTDDEIIQKVIDYPPDLIITSDLVLADLLLEKCKASKVLLIPNNAKNDAYFLAEIFHIKAFLSSSRQMLKL